jgi:hypothetical protein
MLSDIRRCYQWRRRASRVARLLAPPNMHRSVVASPSEAFTATVNRSGERASKIIHEEAVTTARPMSSSFDA